jgi:hypothetical protein
MTRFALVVAGLCWMAVPAHAEDPNRWQAWVSPTDGESNALDVSMVTGDRVACGKKPYIQLQPRVRNRYQERVTGHLKIEHIGTDGNGAVETPDVDLQPGETKILALAAFCHDYRQSLKFSIADLKFPAREAEKAALEAKKAAAEKAAAEEAAKKKAEKDKAAAEQAAIEAAKREAAKKEAERMAKEGDKSRKQTAEEIRAGEHEAEESRNANAEGARYREKRQAEAELEANRKLTYDELAADQFRNGELTLSAPLGFLSTDYTAGTEGRFTYGLRGELRLYKWIKKISPRGAPLSGSGFEFAASGGFGMTRDLGETTYSSETFSWGGQMHARYWHGALGIGVYGDWAHTTHTPTGGMEETYDLYSLGPELAFGIVASRSLGIEAAVRAGPVASGNGLTFDTSNDLFVSASALAELNYLYGGAVGTRYVTSSSIDSWTAFAVLGVRLPF